LIQFKAIESNLLTNCSQLRIFLSIDKRSHFQEWAKMKQKDMYTLEELYGNLKISLSKLSKIADINEGTLIRIRKGLYSVRKTTVNKLLDAFSEVYGRELSLDNVTGIRLEDKRARHSQKDTTKKAEKAPISAQVEPTSPTTTSTQKRAYKLRETGLPEGCILASEFATSYGIKRPTFYDHMLTGLGPEKDRVDYSERPKPGRPNETERYLTPEQQAAALDFWKRHGVSYQTPQPDSAEEPVAEEPLWYLPDGE
jgi:hypothetical protein